MKHIENLLAWFSDRNNITFLIAIAGFAMSIYNFVVNLIENHTRINVEIPHIFWAGNNTTCTETIHIKVINLSKIPVVLSRITVENYKNTGSFGSYKRPIYVLTQRTGGHIDSKQTWISDQLPIKIEGNGCANLLLAVDSDKPAFQAHTENTVRIHTARKTFTEKIHLSSFSDWKLLSKCREPDCQ